MKYPVIKVKKTLSMFKHGSKALTFHLGYDSEESDDVMWNRYRESLIEEVCKAIEGQFVINQATSIKVGKEWFVVFKENVDSRILDSFIKGLLANLDECLEHKERFHFALLKALILVEGKEPGIFVMHQVGADFLKSEQYAKAKVVAQPELYTSKVNYLSSFEHFEKSQEQASNMYYI